MRYVLRVRVNVSVFLRLCGFVVHPNTCEHTPFNTDSRNTPPTPARI